MVEQVRADVRWRHSAPAGPRDEGLPSLALAPQRGVREAEQPPLTGQVMSEEVTTREVPMPEQPQLATMSLRDLAGALALFLIVLLGWRFADRRRGPGREWGHSRRDWAHG